MKENEVARPKAGFAFVKLDSKYLDKYGDIIIPESVQSIPGKIGTVVAFTPYRDELTWTFERGTKVARNLFHYNDLYKDLLGKHVVCDTGYIFTPTGRPQDKLYVVRLESITLIVDDAILIEQMNIHYNDIPRCRTCKSAGEDNMILDSLGYCPRCGLNDKGEHRSKRDLGPCSDELSYTMHKHQLDKQEHDKLSKKIVTYGKGVSVSCKRGCKKPVLV